MTRVHMPRHDQTERAQSYTVLKELIRRVQKRLPSRIAVVVVPMRIHGNTNGVRGPAYGSCGVTVGLLIDCATLLVGARNAKLLIT